MAGVFAISIPQWLQSINYISILRYGTRLIARYEFDGLTFDCSPSEMTPQPGGGTMGCPFQNGQQVLELYEFNEDSDAGDLLAIGFLTVGYRAIAYLTLRWAASRRHFGA